MHHRYFTILLIIILLNLFSTTEIYSQRDDVMKIDLIYLAPFNTVGKDISPVLYQNGIVFSSDYPNHEEGFIGEPFLDLHFIPLKENGTTGKIKGFDKKLNTEFHDGSVSFSDDFKTIFISRNVYSNKKISKNKINRLKIVSSEYNNNKWSKLKEFPYNNKDYSVGHPALSPDGKKLFFTSDMPGGFGATDIYLSELINGEWSEPKNLGAEINTSSKEMFPYIDKHNNLYFSSQGHNGLGGLDIFIAGNISKKLNAKNLGTEINSTADDFGFFAQNEYEYIMFCSNRSGGKGQDDIYIAKPVNQKISGTIKDKFTNKAVTDATVIILQDGEIIDKIEPMSDGSFAYYPGGNGEFSAKIIKHNGELLPENITTNPFYINGKDIFITRSDYYLSGQINDKKSGLGNEGVTVELIEDENIIKTTTTDANGNYKMKVEKDKSYKIHFWKEGFFNKRADFIYSFIEGDNNTINTTIKEIEGKKIISIENIHYDFDKWNIRDKSDNTLSQLLQVMRRYPHIKLVLSSYADCRGSDDYNMKLSEKRSKSVADFLLKKGIPQHRMELYSYGEAKAKSSNYKDDSPEELHQENRRTDIYLDLQKTLQLIND